MYLSRTFGSNSRWCWSISFLGLRIPKDLYSPHRKTCVVHCSTHSSQSPSNALLGFVPFAECDHAAHSTIRGGRLVHTGRLVVDQRLRLVGKSENLLLPELNALRFGDRGDYCYTCRGRRAKASSDRNVTFNLHMNTARISMNSIQDHLRCHPQWLQQFFGLDSTAFPGIDQSQREGRLNLYLASLIPTGVSRGVEIYRHRKSWCTQHHKVFTSENDLGRCPGSNGGDHFLRLHVP